MAAIHITFTGPGGPLAGTVLTPANGHRGPAALLISGSGPIDRDSNMKKLRIDVMGQVARHLAAAGVTTLRYDKRGVGASGGDYLSTGFHDNVADAATAVRALRERPEVDPGRTFVVGHSEGALIATELGARDADLAGVALLAGTATDGRAVLTWQAERLPDSLPRPVAWLLDILPIDILRSQRKRLDRIAASTDDTIRMQFIKLNAKWLREFMAHDPARTLPSVRVPVLAVTGAKDLQVDPDDTARICRLTAGACTDHVIDDLTHLLRRHPGAPSLRTYKRQAKRPVDPELLDLLSGWMAAQAGPPTATPCETGKEDHQ